MGGSPDEEKDRRAQVAGGARDKKDMAASAAAYEDAHTKCMTEHTVQSTLIPGMSVKVSTIPVAGIPKSMCVAKVYIPTGIRGNIAAMTPDRQDFPWEKTSMSTEHFYLLLAYILMFKRYMTNGLPGYKKTGRLFHVNAYAKRFVSSRIAFDTDGNCVITIIAASNTILAHLKSLLGSNVHVVESSAGAMKKLAKKYENVYKLEKAAKEEEFKPTKGHVQTCANSITEAIKKCSVIISGDLGSINPMVAGGSRKKGAPPARLDSNGKNTAALTKIVDKITAGVAKQVGVKIPSSKKRPAPKNLKPAKPGKEKKAKKPKAPQAPAAFPRGSTVGATWTPNNAVCSITFAPTASGLDVAIGSMLVDTIYFAPHIAAGTVSYNVNVKDKTVTYSGSASRFSATVTAIGNQLEEAKSGLEANKMKKFALVLKNLVHATKNKNVFVKNFVAYNMLMSEEGHYSAANVLSVTSSQVPDLSKPQTPIFAAGILAKIKTVQKPEPKPEQAAPSGKGSK
jgi:hypothetical protein